MAIPPDHPLPEEPDEALHDPDLVDFLELHYPHEALDPERYHQVLTRMCFYPPLVTQFWAEAHHDVLETYLCCFEALAPKVPPTYSWWFQNWQACSETQTFILDSLFYRHGDALRTFGPPHNRNGANTNFQMTIREAYKAGMVLHRSTKSNER